MSAETPVQTAGNFTRLRMGFRAWRGTRPFWAGLFTLLGGVPIAYFPYATLKLGTMSIAMSTTAGAGSLIIGVLLMTLGLTMWFQQATRFFAGVAAIILALVSLVISNIGGFIMGFLLAMIGGALALSWAPGKPAAEGAVTEAADEPAPAGAAPEAATGDPVIPAQPQPSYDTPVESAGGEQSDDPNGGHRVG